MTSDYSRIERAIHYLDENSTRQPSLAEVAKSVHLSEFHFQRLFRRWAGVSPKRFLQFLTVEHAKELLAERRGVLDAAYGAGLSGPSRLHDLFVTLEGITPGDWKSRGEGVRIDYGVHDTPFGPALVAATERGVCAIRFLNGPVEEEIARLGTEWPGATVVHAPERTEPLAARSFTREAGAALPLYVRGTNFQLQVWRALLSVPEGGVVSYEEIADRIDRPRAVRAVASAVAANPVAYLIPCHRVIRKLGSFGEYRWGAARKRAILGWESARREAALAG